MSNSSFNAIPFDWTFGNPRQTFVANSRHYQGDVVVYSQADFDALFALQRPTNQRATGSSNVYNDYWPPDPTHVLLMINGETHNAILNSFQRNRKVAGNAVGLTASPDNTIHEATADFILTS